MKNNVLSKKIRVSFKSQKEKFQFALECVGVALSLRVKNCHLFRALKTSPSLTFKVWHF